MNHHLNSAVRPEDQSKLERLLSRMVKLQWWILLALGVAGGVFYYRQPLPDPEAVKDQIVKLTAEKQTLETQYGQLVNRVEWAKSDDEYLQIIARDRLNKQKEGEVILRFKD